MTFHPCGAPGAIRTRGLQSRSLTLYPTELRVHPLASQMTLDYSNIEVDLCQGIFPGFSCNNFLPKKQKSDRKMPAALEKQITWYRRDGRRRHPDRG